MPIPSKYNKRVKWEEKTGKQTNEGHWITEWGDSELGTSWAQVRHIRGNEFIMAGANQVKMTARINIRYRQDIETKYFEKGAELRLNFNGRIFEIIYINNIAEQNVEIEMLVNEIQ